jgi:hypothetical protein
MSRQITSQVLGQLKQDDRFQDWWNKENVDIPFFSNIKLTITFMDFNPDLDTKFITEADKALSSFMKLGDQERHEISDFVYKNFVTIKEEVDYPYWSEELRQIKNPVKIWNFIQPMGIFVTRRPYGDNDIFIDVSCDCEWEKEHGLQLVFRQGKKLTRVSQIDGHLTDADAHDIPDDQDELLSKF